MISVANSDERCEFEASRVQELYLRTPRAPPPTTRTVGDFFVTSCRALNHSMPSVLNPWYVQVLLSSPFVSAIEDHGLVPHRSTGAGRWAPIEYRQKSKGIVSEGKPCSGKDLESVTSPGRIDTTWAWSTMWLGLLVRAEKMPVYGTTRADRSGTPRQERVDTYSICTRALARQRSAASRTHLAKFD